MQPVFDKSRNSRAVGSSSTAWTLPPCQVTVRPKDRGRFWGEVKAKVEGLSGDADAGAGPAVSDVQLVPSRVPASDPVGPTGQDKVGAAASSEGLQALPVLQGATHNTYQPLAWQALTELRDAVGKYGLGSAEVMQIHAMVSTPTPPLTIPKGTRIAQPVLFKSSVSRTKDRSRGDGGFGSTGPPQVRWTAVLTKDHPETLYRVHGWCHAIGDSPSWPPRYWGRREHSLPGCLAPAVAFEPGKDIDLRLRRNEAMLPRALSGVCKQFPDAHICHYMDDILVATPTQDELLRVQPQLLNALHSHGLQVAPEKVQQQPPWKYLGVKILERTIGHQEVQFVQSVKTLNDAQKLVGVITWLRPYLGLTTAQLSPLFQLLKGDTDLKSPRELTPEAQKVLEEVQQAVSACQVYRIEPSIDVTVFITTPDLHPTGIIGQWNDDWTDPLHILEWVLVPHQLHKTATALFELIARLIIKCRQRCLQLMVQIPQRSYSWFRGRNLIGAMRTMFHCKVLSRVFQGRSLIICLATSYYKWQKILNFLYDPKIAKSQCKVPPSSLTVRGKQEKPLLPGRMDLSGRFWKAMRMGQPNWLN
ncbi:hypothetical protein DUI87_08515 [Hirundo rustica rustica]|uniref:ribonuclease H n=1 Tax=Hirundo rustica rustica TaxID=333673 RepID=A0A3M0KSM4_HIRRU|nr:hypothetical protein DUI87_08515 [Hirundo rustica rustica]